MSLRTLPGVALILAAGAVAGVSSAMVAIESLGWSPAAPGSIWNSRDTSPDAAAHPYAVAHYLLQGRLPASDQTHEFGADRDSAGNRISADCTYTLSGTPDITNWWSLSAGSGTRGTDPRSTFLTSSDAVRNPDGTLTVTLSPQPMTGNWIRPPTAGRYVLIYTVAGFFSADHAAAVPPFTLAKARC